MKKELIEFVVDHLKTFKAYPLEFEYKNKVYHYKTIMKIINNRKNTEGTSSKQHEGTSIKRS